MLKTNQQSRADWNRLVEGGAQQLVHSAFQALLGRDPDPDALSLYSAQLRRDRDLGQLLKVISGSEEHWQHMLRGNAASIIGAAYRAILQRAPDRDGADLYTKRLEQQPNLEELLCCLLNSEEFRAKVVESEFRRWQVEAGIARMDGNGMQAGTAGAGTEVATPIFVHSHRRSGTHALIDLIRRNFEVHEGYFHQTDTYLQHSVGRAAVIKDHGPLFAFDLMQPDGAYRRLSEGWANIAVQHYRGKHLYIYRNPRECLRSQYYFDLSGIESDQDSGQALFKVAPGTSFRDYVLGPSLHENAGMRSRLTYWRDHVQHWFFLKQVLPIKAEALMAAPETTLKEISAFLGMPVVPNADRKPTEIRNGHVDALQAEFPAEWTDELEAELQGCAGALLKLLGY